jgi:hypothetical protein
MITRFIKSILIYILLPCFLKAFASKNGAMKAKMAPNRGEQMDMKFAA